MGSRRDSRWLLGWVGFRWSLSRNRSLSWPLESVSYRNHIAKIAADASDAAAPCTWMHHGTVAPQQAHRPRSGGTEVCLFGRCQVATQVERTVEHAEDFDVTLRGDQVGDPIVAIQEHADFWPLAIAIADLRERQPDLGSLMDGEDGAERGLFVVRGDVVVDVLQPAAWLRPSRLLAPRLESPPHLLVADRASSLRIRQTPLDHRGEGELLDDLFEGAVVRLLVDHAPQLIFRRGRCAHAPIVAPRPI